MKRVPGFGMMICLAMGGLSVPAHAQSGGLGGLGGLLGGALPDIGSVGASNAAGVLSYCVENKLLRSTSGAAGVLGKLTGQEDVAQSDAFKLGQSGTIESDGGQFSLDSLKGKVKNSLCDMVLKHARTFL